MSLKNSPHKEELREAGWHSRGYLPHFDGREVPQFITSHLFDSVPGSVLERWKRELDVSNRVATMIQNVLLGSDGESYRLSAWVVMPNHIHLLATRFENYTLADIMQSLKSITSHKANRLLNRHGQFWMLDYFDRYVRNAEHFLKTMRYIEDNPVKARLCKRPEDWPFSSAWFRAQKEK